MPNEFIPFGGAAETLGWDAIYNGGAPFQVGALITAASTNAALRMSSLVAAAVGTALGLNPNVDASLSGVTANSFLAGAGFSAGVLTIPNAGLEIKSLKVTTSINLNDNDISTTGKISGGSLEINKAAITDAGVISTSQTEGGTTTGVQLSPAGDIIATGTITGTSLKGDSLNINNKATIDSDGDIATNGTISGASLSIASGTVAINNTGISTNTNINIASGGNISATGDISCATVSANGELSGDSLNINNNVTIDNAGNLSCVSINTQAVSLRTDNFRVPSITLTQMNALSGSGSGSLSGGEYKYTWESYRMLTLGAGLYFAIIDYQYTPSSVTFQHQVHVPLLVRSYALSYQNEMILPKFTSLGPTTLPSTPNTPFILRRAGDSSASAVVSSAQSCCNMLYNGTDHNIKITLSLISDIYGGYPEATTPPVVTVNVYKLFSIS